MDSKNNLKSSIQQSELNLKELFRSIDKNEDGKITLAELNDVFSKKSKASKSSLEVVEKIFNSIDEDGNGFISMCFPNQQRILSQPPQNPGNSESQIRSKRQKPAEQSGQQASIRDWAAQK